jgi:conjugative relaxase-like TrwC/TraI family protein
MLSPKTQTNLKNAKAYFEQHLRVSDYYVENERVHGEWLGIGAAQLGLAGAVTQNDFVALCENKRPASGERLTQRQNSVRRSDSEEGKMANRRIFYDFVFSPPKSLSVAALVINDARIVKAHADAVKVAMLELEQFAETRVRGAGQNLDRFTKNIIAALFEHHTSRARDPHLHTHCVVFNATHDKEEHRWKALQNYQMLDAQKYAENVYYHELARALRGFGYTIINSARGDFEIGEVSPELCQRFSKRHEEIDEATRIFLAEHPEKRAENRKEIREHIANKTRPPKAREPGAVALRKSWLDQLEPSEIEALRIPEPASEPIRQEMSPKMAISWAEEHVFERNAVVREHELWRHALSFARGNQVSVADIQKETASRGYIREGDKVAHQDALAREWAVVEAARDGIGRYVPFGPAGLPTEQVNELKADQRCAAESILASTNFITLFRGGAGTGKSYVLRSIQRTLDLAGAPSVVLTPQRQQAIDLTRDGLAHAQTVSGCLQRKSIPEGAVVIVDEAGQIGGRQLFDLVRLVQEHKGRLILSGDTRQHGPVEASDSLRAIERYSGVRAAELNEIRRQDPDRGANEEEKRSIQCYRKAVEAAARGELEHSLTRLEELGSVTECAAGEMADRLSAAYLKIRERGESAIVVSQTRAEVRTLNENIRARLREHGLLTGDESKVASLERIDLTTAQMRDARHYPADSVLVFNQDFRGSRRGQQARLLGVIGSGLALEVEGNVRRVPFSQLGRLTVCRPNSLALSAGDKLQLKANGSALDGRKLANGEVVSIAAINSAGAIRLDDGRVFPPSYRQFDRGYAVTSYGSQGKTFDHVLFGDSGERAASNDQQWYVTISRGRKSIQIFTPDKELLRRAIARSGKRELAMDLNPAPRQNRYLREQILRGVQRGREFARRVCLMAIRRQIAVMIRNKQTLTQSHETQLRNQQTIHPARTHGLAP